MYKDIKKDRGVLSSAFLSRDTNPRLFVPWNSGGGRGARGERKKSQSQTWNSRNYAISNHENRIGKNGRISRDLWYCHYCHRRSCIHGLSVQEAKKKDRVGGRTREMLPGNVSLGPET